MLRVFCQPLHNIFQHDPTMLQDIPLKCCLRLAGPLQCYRGVIKKTVGLPNGQL